MWNEYELTYSYAAELRSEELTDISDIKKQINILKANIKKLGVVNVNAIEEYKEVSERYNFLKTQHDDMIKAAVWFPDCKSQLQLAGGAGKSGIVRNQEPSGATPSQTLWKPPTRCRIEAG